MALPKKKMRLILIVVGLILVALGLILSYHRWMAPTRILVVNALPAQQADLVLSNDSRHISVDCVPADEMGSLAPYDAVVIYARRIFLTDEQVAHVRRAAERGVPVFTKSLRSTEFVENHNLDSLQVATLQHYFDNESRQNLRSALRYLRHLATPQRLGDQDFEQPREAPHDVYYHRAYGRYFATPDDLTAHLRAAGLYHADGQRLALISGITFPLEGNRPHVDTLITMLTQRGFNVYPLSASGPQREAMLRQLKPDAIVYMAMGRIGNDSLVAWLHGQNIPIFSPFPISMAHDDWMDPSKPLSTGTKNARIVIPEIDGAVAPYCLATQRVADGGYLVTAAEGERCQAFCELLSRHMALRQKTNAEKRVAIAYFKRPGRDALLASGMEVIPSLYNLLRRLQAEGYDVSGLPATEAAFARLVRREGIVLGTYAEGAQRQYLAEGKPLWIHREQYEQWASEVLSPAKYAEVVARYGPAPGTLLARGDSLAVACLRFGNVLLFPQPRPALGDDDFRVVHGVSVAPPHSYLAPYLYMQRGFRADVLLHFGTHGNLEYTPGRDAAMRRDDWSQQLVGPTPHFYLYTTGNIGEAIIAKRRSAATLITYLTPPYAESGLRSRYEALHAQIHRALAGTTPATALKRQVVAEGLHRPLGIDSTLTTPLTTAELERLDDHVEDLMNEPMQGAFYTLGVPYSAEQLRHTVRAMSDDAAEWSRLEQLLRQSTQAEMDALVSALSGGAVAPAPGGDPVMNANVLPTGRNMFSINPDNTPDEQAWDDGRRLADEAIARYLSDHGDYPRKVGYTLWAGEFIATGGATVAQALWMLGVEPQRDAQGRIGSLRLVPQQELGRPRIDVVVQVSGQLRDVADSRLKLITEAVRLASEASEDSIVNYVRQGTLQQERDLIDRGTTPEQARQLSALRVFGPANSGYSTGMMNYIERSGSWTDAKELVDGYLNNMCAAYGDDDHWGLMQSDLFATALQRTALTVQPRQSNTWGPLSLDHVYEFTGAMSLTVKTLTGREPDALMADYRNPRRRRLQGLREAIDVEARTTILNPQFIRERMKGDEGTAQMFGETFRNIFGWNVTRPTALDSQLYDRLYSLYIADDEHLGLHEYFEQTNPAALQAVTAVMLESARKGYWQPTAEQLQATAELHAGVTAEHGAACTDFVCNNTALQQFVTTQLPAEAASRYSGELRRVRSGSAQEAQAATVLRRETASPQQGAATDPAGSPGLLRWALILLAVGVAVLAALRLRRRRQGRKPKN